MSNEPPQDSTPETELDDILSQATALTSNLKEELGGTEGPAASPAPDPLTGVAASTSDTVECELNELERLVSSTSKEVGSDAGGGSDATATPNGPADEAASSESPVPETPVPDPAATADPDKPKSYAVPDFMSEFTEPEAPQEVLQEVETAAPPPKTETVETAPAADPIATPVGGGSTPAPKPGEVGTGRIGVVGTPDVQTEIARSAEPANDPRTQDEPESEGEALAAETPKATAGDALCALGRRLAPVAFAMCARGVRLLETVDRPLGMIGPVHRRLLGWLAIATLGTASIVYVVSLW